MKWLCFMNSDVCHYFRADAIQCIDEVGDKLHIVTNDGKEHEYEGVSGVYWSEDPPLDYWQAAMEAKEQRENVDDDDIELVETSAEIVSRWRNEP